MAEEVAAATTGAESEVVGSEMARMEVEAVLESEREAAVREAAVWEAAVWEVEVAEAKAGAAMGRVKAAVRKVPQIHPPPMPTPSLPRG